MKIRAQSLAVGDKIRTQNLTGTVISVERNFDPSTGVNLVHVVVKHAKGTIACKDFVLGRCVTIQERSPVSGRSVNV